MLSVVNGYCDLPISYILHQKKKKEELMTKRDTALVVTVFIAAFAGAASWQLYQEYRVRSALESFFQSTANMFKSLTAEERKQLKGSE